MKETIIRRVIILGAVAIAGILGTQSYWLITSWNLNEDEFLQKTNLALFRVAKTLSEMNDSDLPSRDIVRQRSNNTFVVNTESEIYSLTLEYLLQRELEQLALNVDFEYAIFDCTTDQMLYGGYCTYRPDSKLAQPEATDFAKEDDFTYYFTVKFPGRTGFLLRNMQLVLFLSVILLITVAFFAYSMTVILRQRRLATMQKDFINNMTHEFKTPLSTIRIAASVFQREPFVQSNDRLKRYANIIHEQYDRLNNQVEKVLQIAKIEEGRFTLNRETIELHQFLEPLLASTKLRIEEVGGQFTSALPPAPIYVTADPLHLSNILHSLLDNAIKYSLGSTVAGVLGTETPQVQFQLVAAGPRQLQLSIIDSGPGIPADQRDRVFEKFYRIPTGDVHNVKGFGLGLYYVREICKAHGWHIEIDPDYTAGTWMKISLAGRSQTAALSEARSLR
ncbi:MAG: HAMP domain-containing sensor histidine kinase [Bacteroidota bacterium]